MTAYQSIFSGIPYIVCTIAVIGVFNLAIPGKRILIRSIFFAPQIWIIAPFYFLYTIFTEYLSSDVLVAGYLEICFFIIYIMLFKRLYLAVSQAPPSSLNKMLYLLKLGMVLLCFLSVPIYFQGGVGIFSEGGRIDFLIGSRLNLYIVYANVLLSAIMVPIIATIVSIQKRWNGLVLLYVLLITISSILSASKGAVVITMMSIISLLHFERTKDYFRLLCIPICCLLVMTSMTVYFVGEFLSLNTPKMLTLMFNRLFIVNDGRALALDWSQYLDSRGNSVFKESFRNFARLIFGEPKHPVLGQILYSLQFGTTGLVGANTSSTALFIAYGNEIEKSFFAVALLGLLIVIFLLSVYIKYKNTFVLATGILLVTFLSQDFLAFQLVTNLLILLGGLYCIFLVTREILRSVTVKDRITDKTLNNKEKIY